MSLVISIFALLLAGFSLWIQYFEKPKIRVRLARTPSGSLRTQNYSPVLKDRNNTMDHIVHRCSDAKEIVIPTSITFFLEICNVGRTSCGVLCVSYDLKIEPLSDAFSRSTSTVYIPLDNCYLLRGAIRQEPLPLRLPQNFGDKNTFNCEYSIEALRVEGPFGFVCLDEKDLSDMNTIIHGVPFRDA